MEGNYDDKNILHEEEEVADTQRIGERREKGEMIKREKTKDVGERRKQMTTDEDVVSFTHWRTINAIAET